MGRVLASDMAKGTIIEGRTRTRGKHVDFELPESFTKYYEADYITRATSADGVLIKVQRHRNVEGADLAFLDDTDPPVADCQACDCDRTGA